MKPTKKPARKSVRNTFDGRADFLVPLADHSCPHDDEKRIKFAERTGMDRMRPPQAEDKSSMTFSMDDRVFRYGDSTVKIDRVRLHGFKIQSDVKFNPGSPNGVRVETVRNGLVTVCIDLGFDLKNLTYRLYRELRNLKKENRSTLPRPPRSEMDARVMWQVYDLSFYKKQPEIVRELGLTKDRVRNYLNTADKLIHEVTP